MKSFIMDVLDGCKPSNQPKNWWFYLLLAIGLIALPIGIISGVVSMIVFGAAGNFQVFPLIITIICALAFAMDIIVCNKLR